MDKIVADATTLHRAGKLDEARDAYLLILEARPGDPDVHHFYGLLLFQQGDYEAGMKSVETALDLFPEYAAALNNLANMKMKFYRLDEAEALYQRSVALDVNAVEPRLNLGVIARAKEDYSLAEQLYESVLSLDPDHLPARISLSNLYTRLGHYEPALNILQHCLELPLDKNNEKSVLQNLGRLCQVLGKHEDAITVYRHWTEKYPDDVSAAHMLAAATGENIPEKADKIYLKSLFDRFAGSFDEVLDNLEYQAPQFIKTLVEQYYPDPTASLTIVDAGCGTGLCGHFLKPIASTLTGVDISSGMLERARFREDYDHLVEAELNDYFTQSDTTFDLIVFADTLCYFGDLQDILQSVRSCMHEHSRLIFTVERLDEPTEVGYQLEFHGRYCHSRDYLMSVLAGTDLQATSFDDLDIRLERSHPARGYLISAMCNR